MNGNDKGIVLLSVVIILLTITIIGTSLIVMLTSVNLYTRTIADETKAFYLAEAGIAKAINLLRTQAGAEGRLGNTVGPIILGEGDYTIKIDMLHSLITSTGSVGGAAKTVELQYRAL